MLAEPRPSVLLGWGASGIPVMTPRDAMTPAQFAEFAAGPGALAPEPLRDDVEALRAEQYDLLAVLLARAPSPEMLAGLAGLSGDASPLGNAHAALGRSAMALAGRDPSAEFFDLFIGLGRGELLPYASYYLTGFLHERPLARVRADLALLGIERVEDGREPEDHIAVLCEVMAGLASGRFGAEPGSERIFFERHLKPWAARFFADLETARSAAFYRAVGTFGRVYMDIEAEAFVLDD